MHPHHPNASKHWCSDAFGLSALPLFLVEHYMTVRCICSESTAGTPLWVERLECRQTTLAEAPAPRSASMYYTNQAILWMPISQSGLVPGT